ncbi:hypothetical protein ACEN8I_11725 [Polaromonas sp. CT11-55]|uniref:hypothetical protein n=1 Tax=Polaromonas sp. CT11-55 TaxID=3243045 RepID=UPI0039A46CE9
MLTAPNFKYGLSLEQVFAGLRHGFQSVRPKLKDSGRIEQWEASRQKMQPAYALFANGNFPRGTKILQEAQELFTTLRRIKGKAVSRQELGDTENAANQLDER